MAIRIDRVDAGSEAAALGLAGGDELLSVDGNELNDTLDYDFYTDSKSFHLKARVADGIREWDVRREERGPFGCDFSTYLGDQKHSCSNHCMFCFIDQLPPGMRESLYFKDDDERLSFLFGNYITMTNMQDHEIDRIIKMHISPINISVHTTNPQLRVRMLANKRAGEVLQYLPRLVEGGIAVNCQLVLCRGINDGDELRRTLTDLLELTPMVQSVAAVPCGVTDYRQNLFKQTPYDAETSAAVIDIMEEFGDECKRRHGKRIIYPSDEWYLKAGRPIPAPEFYEDYDQLENGVGMMSLFRQEFLAELEKPHRVYGSKKLDVVTGTMASPLITEMMDELHRQYPMIEVTRAYHQKQLLRRQRRRGGPRHGDGHHRPVRGQADQRHAGGACRDAAGGEGHLPRRCHHRAAGPAARREGGSPARQRRRRGQGPAAQRPPHRPPEKTVIVTPFVKGGTPYEQTDRSCGGPSQRGQVHPVQ